MMENLNLSEEIIDTIKGLLHVNNKISNKGFIKSPQIKNQQETQKTLLDCRADIDRLNGLVKLFCRRNRIEVPSWCQTGA